LHAWGSESHLGNAKWPEKRMQLTKLRAAPERQDKVLPCAPAGQLDAGTASQLRSVRQAERSAGAQTNVLRIQSGETCGAVQACAGQS
jgi:hypothetical protein